jgi:hypothetical protein
VAAALVGHLPHPLWEVGRHVGAEAGAGRHEGHPGDPRPQRAEHGQLAPVLDRDRSGLRRAAEVGGEAEALEADDRGQQPPDAARRHQPVDVHPAAHHDQLQIAAPRLDQLAAEAERRAGHHQAAHRHRGPVGDEVRRLVQGD